MQAQEKKPQNYGLQLQTSQPVATPWTNPLLTTLSTLLNSVNDIGKETYI